MTKFIHLALLTTAIIMPLQYAQASLADQNNKTAAEEKNSEVNKEEERKKENKNKKDEQAKAGELDKIEPAAGPALMGFPVLAGVGGAAAAGGIAAAAAGGGGGSDIPAPPPPDDGDDDNNDDDNWTYIPPAPVPEEDGQAGLDIINADAAHPGLTGEGIMIGIVDSGIDASHSEFSGRIINCYNAGTGETGCGKVNAGWHATHVTGIAAAARNNVKMMGVAYNASILNADIFDGGAYGVTEDQQAAAFDWIVAEGAQITNNSYNVSADDNPGRDAIRGAYHPEATAIGAAYNNAVNNDVIMVWATGNDNAAEPGYLASLPVYIDDYPEWKELWVAVTALNESGSAISSYANGCGSAADFCISAPGTNILSAYPGDLYASASGTSMATPHVTGALAVLLEKFGPESPSAKTPQEVVDLMFATADKNLSGYDAAIYGHGLLDLDAAVTMDARSAGFVTGSSFDSGIQPVSDTGINFGPAFGDAAEIALNGKLAGVNDRYDRIFFIDLGTLAATAIPSTNSRRLIRNFDHRENREVALTLNTRMNFSLKSDLQTKQPQINTLSLTSEIAPNMLLSVNYGMSPGKSLGLQSGKGLDNTLLSANDQTVNPWLDFAGKKTFGAGIEAGRNLAEKNIKITILGFSSKESSEDPFYGADFAEQKDTVSGAAMETGFSIMGGKLKLSLLTGTMSEHENILGTESKGAFGTNGDTPTFFAGPSASFKISENMNLIGTWQTGWTDAEEAADSLFSDFSTIRTDSFTVGITGKNAFSKSDNWGLILHQPLRISNAETSLTLTRGRNKKGQPVLEEHRINLEPSGRELNLQTFYRVGINEKQDFSAGMMLRFEPGHNIHADPEGVALARYTARF